MGLPQDGKKNKRQVGAGLSLDKFASLGVSKFDKRKKLERIKKQKLIQHSKYSKLKKKLEAQGVLSGTQVKDSVAELEALDGPGPKNGQEAAAGGDGRDRERAASHRKAGPREDLSRARSTEDGPEPAVPGGKGSVRTQAEGSKPGAGPLRPAPADQQHKPGREDAQRGPGHKRPHAGPSAVEVQLAAEGRPDGWKQPRREAPDGAGRRKAGITKDHDNADADEGGAQERHGGGGRPWEGRGPKKLSRLQRLAQQVAEEKAEKQRAKEAAMKEREERMQRIAAVTKERNEQKHLHFKRTSKGQPLMRYRMEKLLSQIQSSAH